MSQKKNVNPLLGASNFNIEDSFGPQPALLVPSSSEELRVSPTSTPTSNLFNNSSMTPPGPLQTGITSSSNMKSSALKTAVGPPPVMSLGPPQPGLFLLPSTSSNVTSIPLPPSTSMTATSASKPRSRYVPPPGIHSSSSSGNLSPFSNTFAPPSTTASVTSMMAPTEIMSSSASVPNFSNVQGPELYPGQYGKGPELYHGQYENKMMDQPDISNLSDEPVYHWYFKVLEKSYNVLNPTYVEITIFQFIHNYLHSM